MKRWRPLWVGAVLAAIAAVLAMAPALLRRAPEYDLVGILRNLQGVNARIGDINGEILATMGSIRTDAEGVGRISDRLHDLERLLHAQQAELDELLRLTGSQAALSRQLEALTSSVRTSTAGMAHTAAVEAGALQQMEDMTQSLAGRLQRIGAANRSMNDKLAHIDQLSAVVLARMP